MRLFHLGFYFCGKLVNLHLDMWKFSQLAILFLYSWSVDEIQIVKFNDDVILLIYGIHIKDVLQQ